MEKLRKEIETVQKATNYKPEKFLYMWVSEKLAGKPEMIVDRKDGKVCLKIPIESEL